LLGSVPAGVRNGAVRMEAARVDMTQKLPSLWLMADKNAPH